MMDHTTRTPLQLIACATGLVALAVIVVRSPVAAMATVAAAGFAFWWRSRGGKRRLSRRKLLRTVIASGLALWVAVFVLGYAVEIFGNPTGADVTAEPPASARPDVVPEDGALPPPPTVISWMRVDVNQLPRLASYGILSTAALWLVLFGWRGSRRRSGRDRREAARPTPDRRSVPNEEEERALG